MFRVLNQVLLKSVYVFVFISSVFALIMSGKTFVSVFRAENIGEASLLVAASILLFVLAFCLILLFFHAYLSVCYDKTIADAEMIKEKSFTTGKMKSLFEREKLVFQIEKQSESSETEIHCFLLDENDNELSSESIRIEKNAFFEMKNLKKDKFEKIRKIKIKDDDGLTYKVLITFTSFNGK